MTPIPRDEAVRGSLIFVNFLAFLVYSKAGPITGMNSTALLPILTKPVGVIK